MAKTIVVNNAFQKKYTYTLTEKEGKNFDKDFKPDLTPRQMLRLGIFGGAYFIGVANLMPKELPKEWWKGVMLSVDGGKHAELNYFKTNASQPLSVWQKKGWIARVDPHGWFEWYCRYYRGRRCDDDARQIKRWKAMTRHVTQVSNNCRARDIYCRPRQRQALLHWAYDTRKM